MAATLEKAKVLVEAEKMNNQIQRCKKCQLPSCGDVEYHWCHTPTCPNTERRYPTDEQRIEYKIGEPQSA